MAGENIFHGNKEKPSAIQSVGKYLVISLALLPLIVGISLVELLELLDVEDWLASQGITLTRIVFAVAVLLYSAALLAAASLITRPDSLVLDEDGFTVKRGFWRRRWSWQELSDFRLRQVKTRGWSYPLATVLWFDSPASDWRSRYLRWYFRLSLPRPAVVIENAYDTPLDDIAATLNEYRERAIGSGGIGTGSRTLA